MNKPLIVETADVKFSYRKGRPIISGLNLKVPQGSIYGFIGPNGAGKTTTLRLLLGLLEPTFGLMKLFGQDAGSSSLQAYRQIGSLIEQPSLYGHLSANENLRIFRTLYGSLPEQSSQALSIVGLGGVGNQKVKTFSLGMKQRLAIAMAIQHQPKLLILDEPTNGLDAHGVVEMRTLIKKLNQEQGTTILISSHLLSEVEKIVSYVGVIVKGALIAQGRIGEITSTPLLGTTFVFEVDHPTAGISVLQEAGYTAARSREETKLFVTARERKDVAQITALLVKHGIGVYSIEHEKNDLEQQFLHLTQ